jgi:hypothetical protein
VIDVSQAIITLLNNIQPAKSAANVSPNDTININETKGLYVGASGDVKADMWDGTTVTFTALSAGVTHPLSVKRVYATGTTATGIVALY